MSTNNTHLLLRSKLKHLRLPTMQTEFEKLAREAAAANEGYEQYLLRLTELEVAARSSNAVQARVRQAGFPVHKDFDTFDFTAVPSVSKLKVLELARGEWIEQRFNICLIGSPGTGKTHVATALGMAACAARPCASQAKELDDISLQRGVASAAKPADMCTTVPPAKSSTPILCRKPSGCHVQCASGE